MRKKDIGVIMKEYRRSPSSLLLRILVSLCALITLGVLFALLAYILVKGIPNIKPALFEWKYSTENLSMMPAVINTLIMTLVTLLFAVPVGIFAAIYLAEYAKRGSKLVSIIRLTTETLSGIPSIVFGLFGYLFFAAALGFGYSMIGGALTLAIMILPVIMRTAEEALLSVPDALREGSFGLGAGRLRTVFRIVIPYAMPGILSGVILGTGRVVGETAALLYTAGSVAKVPESLMGSGRTLAVHMYCLLNEGLYMEAAYAAAVILLVMVVIINLISGLIAGKVGSK